MSVAGRKHFLERLERENDYQKEYIKIEKFCDAVPDAPGTYYVMETERMFNSLLLKDDNDVLLDAIWERQKEIDDFPYSLWMDAESDEEDIVFTNF